MKRNFSTETKEEIISIYLKYPFVVPCDDYRKWEGVVYSQGARYHLIVTTPHYPSLEGYCIFCSHELTSPQRTPNQNNASYDSLLNLLDDVSTRLDSVAQSTPSPSAVDLDQLFALAAIVEDVEKYIGRQNVVSTDENHKWIRLKYEDANDHIYNLTVELDKKYPESLLRVADFDLPDDVRHKFGQMRRLGDLYSCFKDVVELLMPFWEMTYELAEEAWIIEPLEPSCKDVHRRIFLSDNLSVQLTFFPLKVDSMPDIKFLGSLGAVSQARDTYQRNLQESGWWSDSSVVKNLSRLLNLETLPRRSDKEDKVDGNAAKDEDNDCAICYETSVNGETFPAKWCSNKNCSGRFHHACLMEWLNSVATSKSSFDHISGPCPHCDEKIFCPIKLK